jgi:hypothetical protein
MSLGTQYIAPDGYRDLQKECTYHVLMNDAHTEKVAMVYFEMRASHLDAFLQTMDRCYFEQGINTGQLVLKVPQAVLPFWLEPLELKNLVASDQHRRKPKKLHKDRIKARLGQIALAIKNYKEILRSEDPDRLLNKFARECTPPVKAGRFRLAFYSFLAFGGNELVLHYRITRIGGWSRGECRSDVKRGKPSKKGKGFGFNANAMVPKILESYDEQSGLGVKRKDIYIKAAIKTFGCRTRLVGKFRKPYHPKGHPFPSRNQYWYHVRKARSPSKLREDRIGKTKERARNSPFLGSFKSNVSNLMERVEGDAYVMEEAPKGFIDSSPLKPIRVTKRRDVRSGVGTGIGFTLGSETSSGYRAAEFCEAIGLEKYGALFGLDLRGRCLAKGISPNPVTDRGPGSSPDALSQDPEFEPVFKGMPPSGAAQSKAVVEASHPRSTTNEEGPTYIPSTRNYFQLIVEEILRMVSDNESSNVQDRVPDDLLERANPPTPNNLYRELDRLERNDAVPVTDAQAVRAYLTKVTAKLDRRGVVLHGRVFGSKAFDASGARDRLSREQSIDIEVYVLEACVRHIWVDVDGEIIQLGMQIPYRCADEELYVSLEDLKERERFISQFSTEVDEHKLATSMQLSIDAEEATGVTSGTRRRRKGAPPKRRKGTKGNEVAALRKILSGR